MLEKIEVQGLQDLEKQLVALGGKQGMTALRRASRSSMQPVVDQMIETAPYDASNQGEHLRDTIKMTSRKTDSRHGGSANAISVRAGPSKAHSVKTIAAEYGTVKQTAIPFMRPALYDNRHTVLDRFKSELSKQIAAITRRNARQ